MRIRIALAAAAAMVAGGAGIASAAPPPLPVSVTHDSRGVCVTVSYQVPHCVPVEVVGTDTAPPPIVTITHNNGGTQVGTGVSGQPLVGVSDDNRGICYSFSYEIGHCVPPIS